jgi:hypothetical protein
MNPRGVITATTIMTAGLNVGQPQIGPVIAADRARTAAAIVGAIDQHAANAHVAHFAEGDLLRAVGHGPNHSADQDEGEAASRNCSHLDLMSASLIGRLRSSTFRLSATAVSMSLTGSCFSSESARSVKNPQEPHVGGFSIQRDTPQPRAGYRFGSTIFWVASADRLLEICARERVQIGK